MKNILPADLAQKLRDENKGLGSLQAEQELSSREVWRLRLRRLNWDIALQLLLYVILGSMLLYGLISGTYLQYIHPRYKNYLLISLVLLVAMFVAQVPRLWQANLRPRLKAYAWLILPVFFGCFLMQPNLQGLSLPKESGLAGDSLTELSDGQTILAGGGFSANQAQDEAEELPEVAGSIAVDYLHYAAWLLDLNQNPQKYVGKTYTYLARLDQPEAAGVDEFLPGRPVMLCCAADTQSLGVPSKLTEEIRPKLGKWAYVTGTIYLGRGIDPRFPDEEAAWLEIKEIQDAPTPANVFAYYYGDVKIPGN